MTPVTIALEALAKLLEKIVDLEKNKIEDRQTLFNEVVKPLYNELESVASQYIETFRKTKKTFSNDSPKLIEEAIALIIEDREAMFMARIKISAMAKQMEERIKDEGVVKFAREVEGFFYGGVPDLPMTELSMLLNYLKHVKTRADVTSEIKSRIIDYIDQTIPKLEKAWGIVVQSYEDMKTNLVAPQKFVRKLNQ